MPVDAAGVHVRLECSISNLDRGGRAHTRGYEFSQDAAVISINYCRRPVRINQSGGVEEGTGGDKAAAIEVEGRRKTDVTAR